MSNQVYSNPQNKYLPLPGRNGYGLSGDILVVACGTSHDPTTPSEVTLSFSTVQLEEVAGLVDFSNPARIAVTTRGLYSFIFTLDAKMDAPSTVDIDAEVQLILGNTDTGWDDIAVDVCSVREPARGSNAVGSDDRYMQLSYVGYLPAGGTLRVRFLNYHNADMHVMQANTRLVFCKLA